MTNSAPTDIWWAAIMWVSNVRKRHNLLLAGSAVVVGGGFALFAAARSDLAELFAAMGVLGFGVGGFSAAMPGVILAVTPKSETSSAMSFNYVVRRVGYSLGSAIGGLILAAGTGPGDLFPTTAPTPPRRWSASAPWRS